MLNIIGNIIGKVRLGAEASSGLPALPTRLDDLVQFNSINDIEATGGALTATTNGLELIHLARNERVTGKTTVTKIKLITKTNDLTQAYFYIWRKTPTAYEIVSVESILIKLAAGTAEQEITLDTPIDVVEGDFTGVLYGRSTGNTQAAYLTAVGGGKYRVGATYDETPVDWDAETTLGSVQVIHVQGQTPLLVTIGDSINASIPQHASMVDGLWTYENVEKSWQYKLQALNSKFYYQNCGVGGNNTTQIAARFNRDVVLKKPRFAVISGGVNDIAQSVLKSVYIANMTAILDACLANNIIPIVWKIMPWTDGINEAMVTRDDWNADLETLFNTYEIEGKIIIDFDEDLGQFRTGGAVGNLWNIKPEYDEDGVHYTEAGYAKIAEVMLREIGLVYDLSTPTLPDTALDFTEYTFAQSEVDRRITYLITLGHVGETLVLGGNTATVNDDYNTWLSQGNFIEP